MSDMLQLVVTFYNGTLICRDALANHDKLKHIGHCLPAEFLSDIEIHDDKRKSMR
jgi:hypothetical protein